MNSLLLLTIGLTGRIIEHVLHHVVVHALQSQVVIAALIVTRMRRNLVRQVGIPGDHVLLSCISRGVAAIKCAFGLIHLLLRAGEVELRRQKGLLVGLLLVSRAPTAVKVIRRST